MYTVRSSHRLLCPPPPPGSRNPSRRVPDTRHASCLALAYPGWVERIHGRRRCDLVTLLTAAFSLASPSRICRPSFSQDPFTGCHGWRYARTLTVSSGLQELTLVCSFLSGSLAIAVAHLPFSRGSPAVAVARFSLTGPMHYALTAAVPSHGRRRCDVVTLLTVSSSLGPPSRSCRPFL